MAPATVIAVASDSGHNFSKLLRDQINLVEGLGVEGDAHFGKTVQHLSRIAKDPATPNLRQVHLIHAELFDDLAGKGFVMNSGQAGENITTRGIDLLGLPTGTRLSVGPAAMIEVTGLRNPCHQLNQIQDGLMQQLVFKNSDGTVKRLCGVMGVVRHGGVVRPGDMIEVGFPDEPFEPLKPV